jgi:hypothetical protein
MVDHSSAMIYHDSAMMTIVNHGKPWFGYDQLWFGCGQPWLTMVDHGILHRIITNSMSDYIKSNFMPSILFAHSFHCSTRPSNSAIFSPSQHSTQVSLDCSPSCSLLSRVYTSSCTRICKFSFGCFLSLLFTDTP